MTEVRGILASEKSFYLEEGQISFTEFDTHIRIGSNRCLEFGIDDLLEAGFENNDIITFGRFIDNDSESIVFIYKSDELAELYSDEDLIACMKEASSIDDVEQCVHDILCIDACSYFDHNEEM